MQTVIVMGATGMVGRELVKQLLASGNYTSVIVLVRRPMGFTHPHLDEHVIDFERYDTWKDLLKGDALFSCMGTTRAVAGSKKAQYKVDVTYPLNAARAAIANGVRHLLLISAAGANDKSPFFYSRIKGELDQKVQELSFPKLTILRPGQLDGDRTENRPAEKLSLQIMYRLNSIGLFHKYRPVHARALASVLIKAYENGTTGVISLDEILRLANLTYP